MTHGSLFSGIGGFDLAAEWMGWQNIFHCEWNPFGQKVLKHHFPNSITYENICTTDFTIHRGQIDILTGGFPCQPYSTAGKRLGKADERHLFPEMLRAIKEIKPKWIIGENVRGLISWNGGMVFHEVCDDLEREGYEVQPFLIPAAGVNAPHQRYRVWFVAYSNDQRGGAGSGQIQREDGEISKRNDNAKSSDTGIFNATNTDSRGLERTTEERWDSKHAEWDNGNMAQKTYATHTNNIMCQCRNIGTEERWEKQSIRTESFSKPTDWKEFPTVSPICFGDDGLSGRLDSISFPKWRNESIKAGGNAIVPQVALQIFKAIEQMEFFLTNNQNKV